MTAAAVRPDLFSHLFATQRTQPDRRDVAASALSIALHGGAAAALVWASTTFAPKPEVVEPTPIPIVIAAPQPAIAPSSGGGGGGGAPQRSLVIPPSIPTIDPTAAIAPPSDDPWVAPSDNPGRSDPLPPGSGQPGDGERRGGFMVSNEPPALLNTAEVQRALVRNYPAILRDAGVGGRVVLWLLIDENGRVIDTDVKESSGQAAFDSAAARVGELMRFSPGMNRADRVKVWVSLPVVFKTR